MSKRFDVIVVGAGMVGACAAHALAQRHKRIALIEAREPSRFEPTEDYDLRVSAISPGSRAILERFGVWQRLDAGRVCEYEQMRIWHQHGGASLSFDAVDIARDNLGAIVENRHLQQALHECCLQSAQIEWFVPDSLAEILANDEDGVEVRLESGTCLTADLLIGADGRASPTRALAGMDVQSGNYAQTAIVANVDTGLPHRHTAWQRFLSTGPLAFLPLNNGQSSIVWSCDDTLATELGEVDDDEFCARLAVAFEYRLGEITGTSQRLAFPLTWHHCDQWLRGRILVIGDAAHGVHPLAGQGVNLGFSDVDALAQAYPADRVTGMRVKLRRFARQRKSETWLATQSLSGLKWIYGLEPPPLTLLRDLGMRAIENTPWIKRVLMQKAVQNLT